VPVAHHLERPFWMLADPVALLVRDHRPFYGSSLRLVKGPERIECGWWDGVLVVRDYFIAQGDTSVFYWIYRERTEEEIRWFLHGLFA
jgi:protein ImuB